jgi:hypothetical protein
MGGDGGVESGGLGGGRERVRRRRRGALLCWPLPERESRESRESPAKTKCEVGGRGGWDRRGARVLHFPRGFSSVNLAAVAARAARSYVRMTFREGHRKCVACAAASELKLLLGPVNGGQVSGGTSV